MSCQHLKPNHLFLLETNIGVYHPLAAIILHNASLFPINTVTVAAVGEHRQVFHAPGFVEYEAAPGLDSERYRNRDGADAAVVIEREIHRTEVIRA